MFYIVVLVVLSACAGHDDLSAKPVGPLPDGEPSLNSPPYTYPIENSSYIMAYVWGDPVIGYIGGDLRDNSISISLISTNYDVCFSREGARYANILGYSYPEEDARFKRLAEENNDLTFSGGVDSFNTSFAEHIKEIHLRCDADWDDAHPAGSSLDDLSILMCRSYYRFLRSGYSDKSSFGLRHKLTELTPEHLHILEYGPCITCVLPDHLIGKQITFYLIVILDDGRVIESQETMLAGDWYF